MKRTASYSASSSGKKLKRTVTPALGGGRVFARIPRPIYNGEFKLSRMVNFDVSYTANLGFAIAASVVPFVFFSFSAQGVTMWANTLNSAFFPMSGITDIANLFERVKLDKVGFEFTWTSQDGQTAAINPGNTSGPRIMTAPDYTDGTTGVTFAQTQQQGSVKFHAPVGGKIGQVTVYPKFQRVVYFSPVLSSYEPATGYVEPSIDIPHYGLRLGVVNSGSCGNGRLQFNIKLYFSCKNVK